jgi:hypothetical protein
VPGGRRRRFIRHLCRRWRLLRGGAVLPDSWALQRRRFRLQPQRQHLPHDRSRRLPPLRIQSVRSRRERLSSGLPGLRFPRPARSRRAALHADHLRGPGKELRFHFRRLRGNPECGSCSGFQTCGGGGAANVCGCTPTTSCASSGRSCGTVGDGCGNTLSCGSCGANMFCGGSGHCVCNTGLQFCDPGCARICR